MRSIRTLAVTLVLSSTMLTPVFAVTGAKDDNPAAPEANALSAKLSSAILALEVRGALLVRFGMDAIGVSVTAESGSVALTGVVSEAATQSLAAEVALAVDGVDDVSSRLELRPESASATQPVERALVDAKVETVVKLRLLKRLGTTAFDIEVEAADGVVSLRGTGIPESDRELAVEIAQGTSEVHKVLDLLS